MIVNGITYSDKMSSEVIAVLESARKSRTRIRLFLGDSKTGQDWGEENHTIGYVGNSRGPRYDSGTYSVGQSKEPGYQAEVQHNGQVVANFKTYKQTARWVEFMLGNTNTK